MFLLNHSKCVNVLRNTTCKNNSLLRNVYIWKAHMFQVFAGKWCTVFKSVWCCIITWFAI